MSAGSLAVILAQTLQQTPGEPVTEVPPGAVETTVTSVSPGIRAAAEFGGALLGTAAILGAPLAIWLAGGRMGGKGGLGATCVGALARSSRPVWPSERPSTSS